MSASIGTKAEGRRQKSEVSQNFEVGTAARSSRAVLTSDFYFLLTSAFQFLTCHEFGTDCPASTQMYSHAKPPASATTAARARSGSENDDAAAAQTSRSGRDAADADGANPEEARVRAAADRAHGELVTECRARREHVLETRASPRARSRRTPASAPMSESSRGRRLRREPRRAAPPRPQRPPAR